LQAALPPATLFSGEACIGAGDGSMFNLLEIMQAAQGGNAYNNLAQQFGIGTEQAQKAVEALLPAMSMGLQQQARAWKAGRTFFPR
jgi:hypothetical protein